MTRLAILPLLGTMACHPGSGGPFVHRLTSTSDPAAPEINLTQWNWNRQLATGEDGGVHAVWAQLATTNIDLPADRPDPVDTTALPVGQIFYVRSGDRGQTWTAPLALTARETGIDSASAATSGSDVYVLWRAADAGRLRVFLRTSTDGGMSFGPPVAVSDNPLGVSVSPPALAASTEGVFAVWADGRGSTKEIFLAASADRGASFGAARPVSIPDGFSSWTPALAVWSKTLHVAWTDERDDVGECTHGANACREEEYYRRSTDGGVTWDAEKRLTFDPQESWAPSLAVWQDSVHLTYLDKRSGFFQVYYQRSTDGGASFGPELQIASDPSFMNAARPTIAARDGRVHLTWFGFTSFEADVYYARSDDDGATWSPLLDLTTDGAGAARMPHVAVAPDQTAHILWYDSRFSDASGARIELFHARPGG